MSRLPNVIRLAGPERGLDGRSVLGKARAPVITDGRIGDFWVDTAGKKLYGPKTAAGWPDNGLIKGDKGWTAVTAIVSDGARRVIRIVDYTGGEGTEPTSGQYVGAIGLVTDIADAIDIRGATGPELLIDDMGAGADDVGYDKLVASAEVGGDNEKQPLTHLFGPASKLDFGSVSAAQTTTIPASIKTAVVYSQTGNPEAFYQRADEEPTSGAKFRSTDRFLSDGSTDLANGGWWGERSPLAYPQIRTSIWMPGRDYSLPVGGGAGTAATLNACMATIAAAGGGELLLPPEQIAVDNTLDNHFTNVLVKALGRPERWHDIGANIAGTRIVPTFTGTVLKHRTIYGDNTTKVNRGGGFSGMAVFGNGIATRLLEVDSVFCGTYHLALYESVGTEAALFKCGDEGVDFGEFSDVQQADIDLYALQAVNGNAHCVVFGEENIFNNVSLNSYCRLHLVHKNGHGLLLRNADNNIFWMRSYRIPGGTGSCSVSKASNVFGGNARDNYWDLLSADTAAIFEGTESGSHTSSGNIIEKLDKGNGTPMPIVGHGASCSVVNGRGIWTPVVTSGAGTLGSHSAQGRYTQEANGKVEVEIMISIATNGSGSHRAGSVCLNSFRAVAKWISALVMPQPGLAAAH